MKIAVINYDELNKYLSEKNVLDDLIYAYDAADKERLEDMGEGLRRRLESLKNSGETDMRFIDTRSTVRNTLINQIKTIEPDILVTYNMAGFEFSTLTDGIAYNLIDCRQIHFLINDSIPNLHILENNLSLNMFVVDLRNRR
jgi:DNA polymerase elongation subunit (family B)